MSNLWYAVRKGEEFEAVNLEADDVQQWESAGWEVQTWAFNSRFEALQYLEVWNRTRLMPPRIGFQTL